MKNISFLKYFLQRTLIALLLVYISQTLALGQCDPPTYISNVAVTNETCPGNGQISLSGIAPSVSSPNKYQFALYTESGTEVYDWQNDSTFSNLTGTSYQVYIRTVCPSGVSETFKQFVNVANETGGTISDFNVYPTTAVNCCNGNFYVEAYSSNWSLIPKYALVNSLNAADIPSNYIRPKQTDNVFDNLCAGTYYVRVFDDCGNYQTVEKVIKSETKTPVLNEPSLSRFHCDSLTMNLGFYNTTPISKLNTERSWIEWPDNSLDTIPILTVNSPTPYLKFNTVIQKLDPNFDASKPFPSSVQWPVTIKVFYKDMCGIVTEFNQVIQNPGNLNLDLSNYNTDRCDSVSYFPTFRHVSPFTNATIPYLKSDIMFSNDNGTTWQTLQYIDQRYTFTLKRNQSYDIKFDICGDILSRSITVPQFAGLIPTNSVRNATSCTGDLFVGANAVGLVTAKITDGPASAQPFPDGVSINNGTGVRFNNLPFGTYTYTVKDSLNQNCLREATETVTISQRPLEISLEARTIDYACLDRTSIGIRPEGNNTSFVTEGRPVYVQVLSQPVGAGLPSTFVIEGWQDNVVYPPLLQQAIAGDYSFRFVDSVWTDCPRATIASISISESALLKLDFDYKLECNGTATITSKTSHKIVSPNTPSVQNYPFEGHFNVRFIDSTNTATVYSSTWSINYADMTTTRTISGIPPGTYQVQVYVGSDSCRMVEKTLNLGFKPVTIANARLLAGCNGSADAATLVAPASQGSGVYTYTLFHNSVADGNQVAGPQSSYIFNNLSANTQYIVVATDECGSGAQHSASGAENSYPLSSSSQKFCPGDNATLSATNIPGATYQWYKNGNVMTGETNRQLTINDMQYPADNGSYTASFSLNNCILGSNSINVVVNCTPLPVTLAKFTAFSRENHVLLEWETTYESKSDGFAIERNSGGNVWSTVGFVKSKLKTETAAEILNYNFKDYELHTGEQLYRLKCVDLDGTYTYSRIRSVNVIGPENTIEIYPNPVSNTLKVRNVSSKGHFSLVDINGKVIQHFSKSAFHAGIHDMDVSTILSGTYLLKIMDHDRVWFKKIIIAH